MKNAFFLLFAAFLFSVVPLSAQIISKGTHTVGSSLSLPAFSQSGLLMPNQAGFTTTKFDDESISPGLDEYFFDQYFINSGYSYFAANDFSIGADLTFAYLKSSFGESTSVFLSPELRYYIGTSTGTPIYLSAAGNMSYVDSNFDFNSVSLSAGYDFFVASDWAIEPRVTATLLIGDEIQTPRGKGFMGELSFRYFPGRQGGDSTTVESALKKGNFLFGGSGTFSSAQENLTSIYFSPRAGYFVTDNLVLGAGLNYVYQKEENSSSVFGPTKITNQILFGNVFSRYYVYSGLFAEFEAGLMLFNSVKVDGEKPELWNPSTWYYNARLGYSWFISPSVALEPSLRFGRLISSNDFEVLDDELNPTVETFETVQQSFGLEFSIYVFLNR